MKTGDLIKQRRKELHLTLKEVATAIGTSEATVSRYESGNIANMGRDKIAALAKVLKISPSVIAGYDDTENTSDKDSEALELFSHLSEENKKKVIDYMLLVLKASEQGE